MINEVHITISEYDAVEGNEISIPLENIEKIEIYDKNSGRGAAAFVFSAIPVIVVLIIGVWALRGGGGV